MLGICSVVEGELLLPSEQAEYLELLGRRMKFVGVEGADYYLGKVRIGLVFCLSSLKCWIPGEK